MDKLTKTTMNKELKEQAHKEFDEKWGNAIGNLALARPIIKNDIDSLIDKTVQHEQERIVGVIDERIKHIGKPGGFSDSAVRSWGTIDGLETAKSIITNKSDINK